MPYIRTDQQTILGLGLPVNTINTDLTIVNAKAHFRLIDKICKVHMQTLYYKEIQTTAFFLICHGKKFNFL